MRPGTPGDSDAQPGGGAAFRTLAGLSVLVIDVHGRQVLYLLLGDVEADAVVNPCHGADRDSHFLAAPQMPLLGGARGSRGGWRGR